MCGPTVYDFSHIGHARTYLVFDLVARYLRTKGHELTYLLNITDVDDKIINAARRGNGDWREVARRFEQEFIKDMQSLNITSIDYFARASEHIDAIIEQITILIDKDMAYATDTGVYFRVRSFERYGKLSRQKLEAMREETSRVEPDKTKENPADFALWKKAKPEEPSWPSPWGDGRPGWHIEDTAITHSFFGPQYDIHGGGLDLIFPHHEAEIAQAEAAYDVHPFVRYWMHSGFITVSGEKMSKSLGNFITIRELLETWPPEVFRMLVFSTHYRSPIDYDADLMAQAASSWRRLIQFARLLAAYEPQENSAGPQKADVADARREFIEALDDDFDTPRALAALFSLIKRANPMLENKTLSASETEALKAFVGEVHDLLALFPEETTTVVVPEHVKTLAQEREELRKQKEFTKADALRKKIEAYGFLLEDTPQGPRITPQTET